MKKNIKKYLIVLLVLFLLILPSVSLAQNRWPIVPDCSPDCGYQDLGQLANNIVNFIVFVLAVPIATVAILVAGIMMVIYSSNASKRGDALGILKTAGIGLILVLAGYLIIQAIIFGLTAQGSIGNALNSIFQR